MKNGVCILWLDGTPTEQHNFLIPDVKDHGFYRQGISISCFITKEAKRLQKAHRSGKWDVKGKRADIVIEPDVHMLLQSFPKYNIKAHALPIFHCNSVWDLYKAIGYDYKKKGYN